MSDEIKRSGKRMQKIPAAEAKVELKKQESTPVEPETAPSNQESKADRLLRNIFFRSGPLPMAPENLRKSTLGAEMIATRQEL